MNEPKKKGRPSTLTDEQKRRILELDAKGMDYIEIAKLVGITGSQCWYFLFKNARAKELNQRRIMREGDAK